MKLLNFKIERFAKIGNDPFWDMQQFIHDPTTIFDVGANVGDVSLALSKAFPKASVCAFEPSPSTFDILVERTKYNPYISCFNCALGKESGILHLNENENPKLNSFLPNQMDPSKVTGRVQVDVDTIDRFCASGGIDSIDILKTDTEGYDLEVLRGATRMMSTVRAVYLEVNFSNKFEGQGSFSQEYELLTFKGFKFVSFYQLIRGEDGVALWADALFVRSGEGK